MILRSHLVLIIVVLKDSPPLPETWFLFSKWQVRKIEGKGRGVFASRDFQRNEFVCEYSGELISHVEAKKREKQYGEDDNIGCYMYYLQSNNKKYWWVKCIHEQLC